MKRYLSHSPSPSPGSASGASAHPKRPRVELSPDSSPTSPSPSPSSTSSYAEFSNFPPYLHLSPKDILILPSNPFVFSPYILAPCRTPEVPPPLPRAGLSTAHPLFLLDRPPPPPHSYLTALHPSQVSSLAPLLPFGESTTLVWPNTSYLQGLPHHSHPLSPPLLDHCARHPPSPFGPTHPSSLEWVATQPLLSVYLARPHPRALHHLLRTAKSLDCLCLEIDAREVNEFLLTSGPGWDSDDEEDWLEWKDYKAEGVFAREERRFIQWEERSRLLVDANNQNEGQATAVAANHPSPKPDPCLLEPPPNPIKYLELYLRTPHRHALIQASLLLERYSGAPGDVVVDRDMDMDMDNMGMDAGAGNERGYHTRSDGAGWFEDLEDLVVEVETADDVWLNVLDLLKIRPILQCFENLRTITINYRTTYRPPPPPRTAPPPPPPAPASTVRVPQPAPPTQPLPAQVNFQDQEPESEEEEDDLNNFTPQAEGDNDNDIFVPETPIPIYKGRDRSLTPVSPMGNDEDAEQMDVDTDMDMPELDELAEEVTYGPVRPPDELAIDPSLSETQMQPQADPVLQAIERINLMPTTRSTTRTILPIVRPIPYTAPPDQLILKYTYLLARRLPYFNSFKIQHFTNVTPFRQLAQYWDVREWEGVVVERKSGGRVRVAIGDESWEGAKGWPAGATNDWLKYFAE